MNNKQQQILQELQINGWIIPCRDAPCRIDREKRSLEKCIRRPGYLGRYDAGIRYCFLWLLERGYDINPAKVHPVFQYLLEHLAELSSQEAEEIVTCRHTVKYGQTEAGKLLFTLNRAISALRANVDMKEKIS